MTSPTVRSMRETDKTDPVLDRLDTIAKHLDKLWDLLFLGLILPGWIAVILAVVLANANY